jgi:hypothetical protein
MFLLLCDFSWVLLGVVVLIFFDVVIVVIAEAVVV